jgi:hypothetical protein
VTFVVAGLIADLAGAHIRTTRPHLANLALTGQLVIGRLVDLSVAVIVEPIAELVRRLSLIFAVAEPATFAPLQPRLTLTDVASTRLAAAADALAVRVDDAVTIVVETVAGLVGGPDLADALVAPEPADAALHTRSALAHVGATSTGLPVYALTGLVDLTVAVIVSVVAADLRAGPNLALAIAPLAVPPTLLLPSPADPDGIRATIALRARPAFTSFIGAAVTVVVDGVAADLVDRVDPALTLPPSTVVAAGLLAELAGADVFAAVPTDARQTVAAFVGLPIAVVVDAVAPLVRRRDLPFARSEGAGQTGLHASDALADVGSAGSGLIVEAVAVETVVVGPITVVVEPVARLWRGTDRTLADTPAAV